VITASNIFNRKKERQHISAHLSKIDLQGKYAVTFS